MTKFQNSKISALLNSIEFMVSMCCKTRSLLLSHTLSFQNFLLPCPHLQKMYGSLQSEFSFPSIPSLYFIPIVQNKKIPALLPSSKSYQNQNKNSNINQIRASKKSSAIHQPPLIMWKLILISHSCESMRVRAEGTSNTQMVQTKEHTGHHLVLQYTMSSL